MTKASPCGPQAIAKASWKRALRTLSVAVAESAGLAGDGGDEGIAGDGPDVRRGRDPHQPVGIERKAGDAAEARGRAAAVGAAAGARLAGEGGDDGAEVLRRRPGWESSPPW